MLTLIPFCRTMHSLYNRATGIFFFTLSTLFTVSMLSMLTVLYHEPQVTASISNVRPVFLKYATHPYTGMEGEFVRLAFDLDADLRDLFTWNAKQVFLYAVARYESPGTRLNEVTVWDRVIRSKEEAVLHLRNEMTEYPILDTTASMRGARLNVSLQWEVMPLIGMIKAGQPRDAGPAWFYAGNGSLPYSLTLPNRYL